MIYYTSTSNTATITSASKDVPIAATAAVVVIVTVVVICRRSSSRIYNSNAFASQI